MSHTILLVEDDGATRRQLSRALRRDGYAVLEAADGYEFLDRLDATATPPDLVMSDVRLPCFSALEVLEGLKVATRKLPVILITGYADDEARERARKLGAFCLLEKPFDFDALRATVRRALAQGEVAPPSHGAHP